MEIKKGLGWNYRIIRHWYTHTNGEEEAFMQIHECYYDKNNNVNSWTENGVGIGGETLEELSEVLVMYTTAFDKPILELINGKLTQ